MFFTVRTESMSYTLSTEELNEKITSCDETFSDICSHFNKEADEVQKLFDANIHIAEDTSFQQLIFILEGNWQTLAQYDEGNLK